MDLFDDLPEPATLCTHQPTTSSVRVSCADTKLPVHGLKRKLSANFDAANPAKSKSLQGILLLKGYVAERRGERNDMQDAHILFDDISLVDFTNVDNAKCRLAYYAVFDGHGGGRASKYASEHLHKVILQKLPRDDLQCADAQIQKVLIESFKKLDEEFLVEARKSKPSWKDGSTAVTVLAVNNVAYISNLGDSKAVLCRFNETTQQYIAVPLTTEHNPCMYDERIRIQKAGGYVSDGRVMGVLEVSRSFGDGPYKNHGVTCVPDIKRCQLTNGDRFIIVGCDGFWKQFDNDGAIKFVNDILLSGTTPLEERWQSACSQLANEAVLRLSADNVTVLLISIGSLEV